MADIGDTIKPQTGLVVCLSDDYRLFSQQTLVEFYQPMMGATAFALLFALQQLLMVHPSLSQRTSHTDLLNQLGFDVTTLTAAKQRLEGLGLVKTFETLDALGRVIVYQLQPTLTPATLVKDDLLSVLLLETVGEKRFDELVASATQYQLDTRQLTETTHPFLKTFHVDEAKITDSPTIIRESRQKFIVSQHDPVATLPSSDFDFSLLLQLLQNQPITKAEIQKHQHLIQTEHIMYGIDEPQMARLIMDSLNIATNEIESQRLKKTISANYQIKTPTITATGQTEDMLSDSGANDPTIQLSSNEQQLIAACETYSPNDFLQVLIGKKGGFVPQSSETALQKLIDRNVLNKSVINMLIYYVIQERNNTSLSQNFIDTIASGWMQAKVTTATEALLEIKQFSTRSQQPQKNSRSGQTTSRTSRRTGQTRETLPDWAQDGYQHQTQKVSEDEVSKIKAQLEALKHQQESEE